jgi:nitrite reductase/ring-hydroxylating ferredoxin subunit
VSPAERHAICALADLPPGSRRIAAVGKYGVGVFNCGGELYALNNFCPHAGAEVCRGTLTGMPVRVGAGLALEWEREGEILRCPWHGWEFEIPTGKSLTDPTRSIRTLPVEVDDGWVYVYV